MPPTRLPRAPFSPATISDLEAMFRRTAAGAVDEAASQQRVILAGKAPTASPTFTGVTDIAQALRLSGAISPAQLTADTNNWAPTGLADASVVRFTTDASHNLTGLTGGVAGRVLVLANVGAQNLVLKDESASSTAANRFALDGDLTLGADTAALLLYDATSSRWRLVAVGKTAVGAAGMTSFTLAGDGGSAQTITDANTLTVSGGVGLASTAGATDTVTVDLDLNSLTADATPDGAADYVATWDASASAHKKVLLSNLPSGGATTLDGLTDVTITSPAANQGLSYDGAGWVNGNVLPAGILTTAGDILVEHDSSYARITPSSATASSTNAGTPSNTYDGNDSTWWQSNAAASTPGQWIRHDLGSAQTPTAVRYLQADATLRAGQWALQSSTDDITYTTRYTSATGQTSVADSGTVALSGMPSARYWRITNVGTSGDVNVWRVHEFALYTGGAAYPTRLPVGGNGRPLVGDSAAVLGVSWQALYQTLTDAATITWNVKSGGAAQVTLGGNRTLAAPTNLIAGQTYTLIVIQDGTGSRTLTWNAVFKWPSATAPTLTTTAAAKDVFTFVTDGTNLYRTAAALDVR